METKRGSEPRARIEAVDVAKGIGIIAVVVGHIPELFNTPLADVIYSFHMPLFFLLSGLLHRAGRSSSDRSLRLHMSTRLVPYATFGLMAIAVTFTLDYPKQQTIDFGALQQSIGSFLIGKPSRGLILWFFPCLLVMELLGIQLLRMSWVPARWFVCLIGAVVGVLLSPWNSVIPWSFDIALVALPFWLLGSQVSSVFPKAERLIRPRHWLAVMLILPSWIYIQLCILKAPSVNMRTGGYGDTATFYFGALVGIAVILLVSALLRRNRVLSLVGRASFVIYPVHTMIMVLLLAFASLLLPQLEFSSPGFIVFRILFAVVVGVAIFLIATKVPRLQFLFTGK